MEMHPVSSSNIAAVGYDPETQTLAVQFQNGGTYEYDSVPQEVFDELRGSDSVGRAFHRLVNGSYEGRRV